MWVFQNLNSTSGRRSHPGSVKGGEFVKSHAVLAIICLVAVTTSAATFTVTTTSDHVVGGCDADCSLREAVIAANATVEHDTIVVPAGLYVLSLVGAGEDSAATGDLDLKENVTIEGDPAGGTVIDGNLTDRLIHSVAATIDLTDLELTRGSTTGDSYGAGGILVESGTLIMTRCVLSDCSCDAHGGGLFSLGTVTLDRSAVIGNTGSQGGGVYHAGATLTMINSTVSGNTATTNHAGGVSVDGLATAASIDGCTITDNVGPEADALSLRSEGYVSNSIFDGSCAVIPGMGLVLSTGGNMESPGDTCNLVDPADLAGVSALDLNLGPLQNNGGSTPTHALQAGSIAVGFGKDAFCLATDQRDWLRWDSDCDTGAFEVGAIGSLLFADGFETGDVNRWSAGFR